MQPDKLTPYEKYLLALGVVLWIVFVSGASNIVINSYSAAH